MKGSSKKEQPKKKENNVITFPVPFSKEEINQTISTNKITDQSKEKLINQAIKFHSEGNILEAVKYYQNCIKQGCNDPIVYSNYGTILRKIGKLKEAALSIRKAIELNPNYSEAHYNLGNTLRELGKLKEAVLFLSLIHI